MKTARKIEQEIENIYQTASYTTDPKQRKKLAKELVYLKQIQQYLKHDVSEDYLKDQLKKIEAAILSLNTNFNAWINSSPGAKQLKNSKSAFEAEVGLKNLKAQKELITFILS